MKYPELPEGIAAYFIHGDGKDVYGNECKLPDTVCLLVRADGKHNNALPTTISKWEILSSGIAFFSPDDDLESRDREKGEIIALGRALKAYRKSYTSGGTISRGDWIYVSGSGLSTGVSGCSK